MPEANYSWNDVHLRRVMDFSDRDLEACREGHLTVDQEFKFRKLRVKDNVVHKICGPVKKSRPKSTYFLSCQSVEIQVPQKIYEIFMEDEVYFLYYVLDHNSMLPGNVLVAAEYCGTPYADDYPNHRLRDTFQLSEVDLDTNRLGSLSPSQKKRLAERNYSLLFMIGMGVAVPLLSLATGSNELISPAVCSPILIMILCFLFVGLGVAGASIWARRRNEVASITGPLTNKSGGEVDLIMNGRRFYVGAKIGCFIPGEIYTIYYLPYRLPLNYFDPVVAAEHHLQSANING